MGYGNVIGFIGKFKFGKAVGTSRGSDAENKIGHADLIAGKAHKTFEVEMFLSVEKAQSLGCEKTKYSIRNRKDGSAFFAKIRIYQNDVSPLKGNRGVDQSRIQEQGRNSKGGKNKMIPTVKSGLHGVIFQNPHGKEKRTQGIVKDVQREESQKNPEQPVALVFLGRIGILPPFIKHIPPF
jgi:hypothetical protein